MNDDDDPDWEREARKAELNERLTSIHDAIRNRRPIDVTNVPPETRIIVTTFNQRTDPVEFIVLDPATGKVLVKDGVNFPTRTEATLLGCEDLEAITPGTRFPTKRVLLRGKLKTHCWPVYEVGGEKFTPGADGIRRIDISGVKEDGVPWEFNIWED